MSYLSVGAISADAAAKRAAAITEQSTWLASPAGAAARAGSAAPAEEGSSHTLLIGVGVLAAAGVGYWLWKKRKKP